MWKAVLGLAVITLISHYIFLLMAPTLSNSCIFAQYAPIQQHAPALRLPNSLIAAAPLNASYRIDVAHATHWIVITSIHLATPSVKSMLQYPHYTVLIVADESSPPQYDVQHERLVYLSVEWQMHLRYRIIHHVPFGSYTRKNIGYLFAIEHGAQFIFDTDDDNAPLSEPWPWTFSTTALFPCSTDSAFRVVNPYAAFGQPAVWPRGLPLEVLHLECDARGTRRNNSESSGERSWIQQGMADLDPDVDAVFRLTRTSDLTRIIFERRNPAYLPTNTMAPFNSQNTLFDYRAFWGLLLPISVTFRVTDIWRGYYVQRLLWMLGGNVLFAGPTVAQHRNAHSFLQDFNQEVQMYEQAGSLIRFLTAWKPTRNTIANGGLFGVMHDLARDMATARFWGETDVVLIDAWIEDLKELGYVPPSLSLPSHDVAEDPKDAYTFAAFKSAEISAAERIPMSRCAPSLPQASDVARAEAWWHFTMHSMKAPHAIILCNHDGRGMGGHLYDAFWLATYALMKGYVPTFAMHDSGLYDGTFCEEGRRGFSCFFDFKAVSLDASILQQGVQRAAITTLPSLMNGNDDVMLAIDGKVRDEIRDFFWGKLSKHGTIVPFQLQQRGWTAFAWFSFLMHHMTQPAARMKAEIEAKKKTLAWPSTCVSVHIRRADKIIEMHTHTFVPIESYVQEVVRLRVEQPTIRHVFMTSDNASAILQFEQLLHAALPDMIILVDRTQTRYNGKECLNFHEHDAEKRCSARNALNADEQDDWARQSVLDFYLLSSCDYLVGSIGSFFTRAAAGRLMGRFLHEPFAEKRIRSVHDVDSLAYFTEHDLASFDLPSLEAFLKKE